MPYRQLVGVGPSGQPVIDDPDPSLLAAHVALTTGAHGIGGDWFQTYLQRGVSCSGITVGQASYFFDDFTDIARWRKLFGAESLTAVTTLTGGVARLSPAAGNAVLYTTGDVTFGAPTLLTGHGRFYLATRLMIAAGPPADGSLNVGALILTGAAATVGYYGAVDPGHFYASINDGVNPVETVSSSIAIDANWHDLEFWCDGVNYYFRVDNESTITLVPTNPPVDNLAPLLQATSGAGDVLTGNLDKYLCVFPQAA